MPIKAVVVCTTDESPTDEALDADCDEDVGGPLTSGDMRKLVRRDFESGLL